MSRVLLPSTQGDLWTMLADHPQAALYAGGTDLLVLRRQGLIQADTLICLERVEDLRLIEPSGDQLFLGATATLQHLLDNPLVNQHFGVLAQALARLGSPPVRHVGTLGGNLATASPAGDTLPPLYVLGAEVELRSASGNRRVAIEDFILGPGQTALASREIIAGVWLDMKHSFNLHHFEKVGARKALAIAMASLAAAIRLSDDGLVQEARLAWGSVGPKVVSSPELNRMLRGQPLTRPVLAELGARARELATPISDLRASADYRLALVGNLPLRLATLSMTR